MISKYNRDKITILSTVVILMVCYLHSYYPEAKKMPIAGCIQDIVTGMFQLANPFFFILSGFLFFNQVKELKDCYKKIGKRVRTLVVPYLLWNVIVALFFVALYFVSPIDINNDIVPTIINGTTVDILLRVFFEPAGFQFFFLRDLICYVLISPILFIGIKYLSYLLPLLLLLLDYFLNQGNLFFFVLGGYIAINTSLDKLDSYLYNKKIKVLIVMLFLIYCVLSTLVKVKYLWFPYAWLLLPLLGVSSVWVIFNYVTRNHVLQTVLSCVCGYSFFIYCFHMPTLNIFKKVGIMLMGANDLSYTICFLVNPILIVILSVVVAKLLKKYCPVTYKILTGGR